MPRRLLVIDGADQGQSFVLPDSGSILIGNSRKHADICLHDLYVGRTHCELSIDGGRIVVSPRDTSNSTLINKVRITQQELQVGDVLRVGNSHLRLEEVDASELKDGDYVSPNQRGSDQPESLPHLSLENLGDLSGGTLGHFELGTVLGRGHTGVVFRARDIKKDHDIALKVLAPDFPASDGEMKQFIQALKPVLPLRHANVVGLQGAGKSGLYVWVALELVEGENLETVSQRVAESRKFKWKPALRLAVHLARALEFLQRHRIVHGNIVPRNVLVPADGSPARLNDLVLQKALDGSELLLNVLENKLLAEMAYLSPEHVDPNMQPDESSDQYCAGAVVYALLTGHAPAQGKTPERTVELIRTGHPEKPKNLLPAVPDAFQAALLKMLAKRPEDRYSTPASLVADLEHIAASRQVDV